MVRILVAGTMETRALFIFLEVRTCLWAHETHLLDDGIVEVLTMRKNTA